jgi:protein-disulfide isomerase
MIERKMMMLFNSIVTNFRVKLHSFRVFLLVFSAFFIGLTFNPLMGNVLAQSQEQPVQHTATPPFEIDEAALKENIAARIRHTRGTQDERFKQFSPDLVSIDKKIPIVIQDMTFYAIKVKIFSPPSDAREETITLVVDQSGTRQIVDIQDLASGNSLLQDAVNQLIPIEDIPPDFGKEIFKGTGNYSMIVISDPFCPYCRKGWDYVKAQKGKLKAIRLSHFPLNRAAEVACMVMADAHQRKFKLFEIVDFAYTRLDPGPNPEDVLVQFMDAFPEVKKIWGQDPAMALKHLEEKYLAVVREERENAQALGISSTPVFFVNGEVVKGFNVDKLDQIMP